jgi:hypothetical protein
MKISKLRTKKVNNIGPMVYSLRVRQGDHPVALPASIRQGWKGLIGGNTLAYLAYL